MTPRTWTVARRRQGPRRRAPPSRRIPDRARSTAEGTRVAEWPLAMNTWPRAIVTASIGIVIGLGACAAPPMGLGTGARIPTTRTGERRTGVVVAGGTAIGASEHRRAFQADGSLALVLRRWFTLEGG